MAIRIKKITPKKGDNTQIDKLTKKILLVMDDYKKRYPDVRVDRDYFPFKITEEWGECLQSYLMLTKRGRQKNKTKQEIKNLLNQELADVFGFLILFAENEKINWLKALEKKWFRYLKRST